MASFKNDFGLSGKLGDVIIYQIGNKSYARRTFRANNPKTIKQQEVRARFLVAIRGATFICHCDDVTLDDVLKVVGDRTFISIDEIKHTTRLGMGPGPKIVS